MRRQRQLQQAIVEQFNPANVLSKYQDVARGGSQVVKTDIWHATLGYFGALASKTRQLPVTDVELVPDSGLSPEEPNQASAGAGRRGNNAFGRWTGNE